MEISYHQRKSRALGISMPTCLQGSGAGSLNVVRGCLFACAYCAWRAIPGSPQDHELLVYRDLAAQL
ncbi:MAG: hypothetical protein FJ098_15755, partial [Deltaproteobacteria bacterium]|nr:hypothetical protein [Deltaproteobacteria bacterium]